MCCGSCFCSYVRSIGRTVEAQGITFLIFVDIHSINEKSTIEELEDCKNRLFTNLKAIPKFQTTNDKSLVELKTAVEATIEKLDRLIKKHKSLSIKVLALAALSSSIKVEQEKVAAKEEEKKTGLRF